MWEWGGGAGGGAIKRILDTVNWTPQALQGDMRSWQCEMVPWWEAELLVSCCK